MSKKEVFYNAYGIVLGNLWGGGRGWYPTRKYKSDKYTDLVRDINEGFSSGTLDSGMGFDGLVGGLMIIEKVTIIYIDGVKFVNTSTRWKWLGKVNKEEAKEVFYRYGGI